MATDVLSSDDDCDTSVRPELVDAEAETDAEVDSEASDGEETPDWPEPFSQPGGGG